MKTRLLLSLIASALSLTILSCKRDDGPVPEPEPEPPVHTYGIAIPAEGVEKASIMDICAYTYPSGFYEVFPEEGCDWVIITDSNPGSSFKDELPLVTVLPNRTGQTRSVEIRIKSTWPSSHSIDETHALVQKSL